MFADLPGDSTNHSSDRIHLHSVAPFDSVGREKNTVTRYSISQPVTQVEAPRLGPDEDFGDRDWTVELGFRVFFPPGKDTYGMMQQQRGG